MHKAIEAGNNEEYFWALSVAERFQTAGELQSHMLENSRQQHISGSFAESDDDDDDEEDEDEDDEDDEDDDDEDDDDSSGDSDVDDTRKKPKWLVCEKKLCASGRRRRRSWIEVNNRKKLLQ